MDGGEELDFSGWTVVDEDVSDTCNTPNKTKTSSKAQTRSPSNVTRLDKNAKPKSAKKPENSSAATSHKNQSSKEESNKTNVPTKDVAKSSKSSGTGNAGRNVKESVISSSTCEGSKIVVQSVTCTSTAGLVKNNVKSTSAKASATGESPKSCSQPHGRKETNDGTTVSEPSKTEVSILETVQGTSLKDKPGGLSSVQKVAHSVSGTSGTGSLVVTQVSSSTTASPVPLKECTPKAVSVELSGSLPTPLTPSSSMLNSTNNKNIDEKVTISQEAASHLTSTQLIKDSTAVPVASTVSMTPAASTISTSQLTAQTTSSQTPAKNSAPMKNKTLNVESIAEIMAAVSREDARGTHCDVDGVEDVSDTELTETMDIATCLVSKSEISKVAGTKRDASPNKGGPAIKKTKVQNSKSSDVLTQMSGAVVKKDSRPRDQENGNQNQKNPKQENQCNKTEENVMTSARNQLPGGMSSTPKGSFSAAKTPVTKTKTPSAASPMSAKTTTTSETAKTNDVENKPGTTTSTTVKRIIRRFHRMTQTVSTQYSNKLVQCLIKIPSLDAPPKSDCHSEVQVSIEKTKDDVFYQKALPDTVRPDIFKAVSTFNVNDPGSRNIATGSYCYGISLGHFIAVDVEKGTFRGNLLSKSAYYSLQFNKQDFGVADLFFSEEADFVGALTQIRKMKIGSRHLVVTYSKHLNKNERAPESSVSSVKVTIIYNQNFASTNFLTNTKAPRWVKPKVEEILTLHNMPEGIPLDFLKLIIPEAITVELDDKTQKFTQQGSRVHVGMDRKSSEWFFKLFTQMYINNECLAFSLFGTPISIVPDLADILKEKKSRENEMENVKELKAVPRDISSTACVGEKEKVDVIMQVDTVVYAKKILSPPESARAGSSPSQKLQQRACPPESNKPPAGKNEDPALSDVSNDLSDISETSNIGVGTATTKAGQKKTSSAHKKPTTFANRRYRVRPKISSTSQAEKIGSSREPLTGVRKIALRKTNVSTSKISESRKETRDRFQDKDRKSSFSKPLDKYIRGVYSRRPVRYDVRMARYNKVSHTSISDRGKERSTRRQSSPVTRVRDKPVSPVTRVRDKPVSPVTRVRDKPEPVRDRSHRDRPRGDSFRRDSHDKPSSRDHGSNAEDRGRLSHTSSRTERIRRKSEEKDNRRVRLTSTADRHGNKIVSYHDRGDFNRKTHDSRGSVTEQFSHDSMDRADIYHERDSRRGNRLDLLVQMRLASSDKQDTNDSREVILTRSRSPITRQVHRGRSASPKKHQSMSVTSARVRQASPSAMYGNQQKFNAVRRLQPPQQASHGSSLSPISAGEDHEARESPGGMWLPQAPTTLVSQQDVRKADSSIRSTNYVTPQAEWKSQHYSDEEEESFDENKSFIEQFVEQMIGTGRAAARSVMSSKRVSPKPFQDAATKRISPKPFQDAATVIEKIREIYNSRVNFHDNISENEDDDILNSEVPSGSQNRSRPAEIVSPVASRNTVRSNISSSSIGNLEPEPDDHFLNREHYERNKRGINDAQRFDAPLNNRSKDFDRESGTIPPQSYSRGYIDSIIRASDQSNSSRHRETGISNYPTSDIYRESEMQDQSSYRQYREPEIPNWHNSGGQSELRMPNSGRYREPETTYQQNSGRYRESEAPNHTGSGAYHQNPDKPLQSPIPPPVVPPLYNSMQSKQEKFAELANMAQMIAADIEQHRDQAAPNSAQRTWNNLPQQASTSGPQPYTADPQPSSASSQQHSTGSQQHSGSPHYSAGPQPYTANPQPYSTGPHYSSGPQPYTANPQPYTADPQPYSMGGQFPFSGPQPAHGPNMNFSGPPHPPIKSANIHQPNVSGANSQSGPWPHNNFV